MGKRPHLSVLDADRRSIAELRDAAAAAGVEIATIAGYTNFTLGRDTEVPSVEMQVAYVRQLADLAEQLGAKIVRIFTGYLTQRDAFQRDWDLCVQGVRQSAAAAAEFGVTLGVQNHHDVGVGTESYVELLDEVDHPNCRAMFDPWSAALHGDDLRRSARQLAPHMVQTTLADYVRLPRYAYQPGLVNYERLADAVRAVPLGEGFSISTVSLPACAKADSAAMWPTKCARLCGAAAAKRTSTAPPGPPWKPSANWRRLHENLKTPTTATTISIPWLPQHARAVKLKNVGAVMEIKHALLTSLAVLTIAVSAWFVWWQRRKARLGSNTLRADAADAHRPNRLTYEESCRALQRLGHLQEGAIPPLPDHRPRYDDEGPLGVNFFRTSVRDGDIENMTLPRTFFGRSDIGPLSFKTRIVRIYAVLERFQQGGLHGCQSLQKRPPCLAVLQGAFRQNRSPKCRLRQLTFAECDFTDAEMRGARLTHRQGRVIVLSTQQREAIDWQESDGSPPGGG